MKEQGTVVRVCVVVEVLASRQMKTFHRALAPVRVLYGVRCVRAACTNVGVVCLSKLWCHRCDNNQLTCNWIYSELHWLKVPERVRCVLTYRCLNNTAPHYLAETIRPVSSRGTRQHLRSPRVERRVDGTRRVDVSADRRCWRVPRAETGRMVLETSQNYRMCCGQRGAFLLYRLVQLQAFRGGRSNN